MSSDSAKKKRVNIMQHMKSLSALKNIQQDFTCHFHLILVFFAQLHKTFEIFYYLCGFGDHYLIIQSNCHFDQINILFGVFSASVETSLSTSWSCVYVFSLSHILNKSQLIKGKKCVPIQIEWAKTNNKKNIPGRR